MKKTLKLCLVPLLVAGAASAATVAVPYTNTFGGPAADFVTNGGTWTVGSGTFNNVIGASDTPTSASVQATGLAGQSFRMSTTFVINSISGTTATGTVGLGALGTTDSFIAGGASNNFLLADVSAAGAMRYVILGSSNTFLNTGTWANGALVAGTSYTMSLAGTYLAGGSMALTFTLSDGTTSTSVNQTLTSAQIPAGTNFGYRNRTNGATGLNVSFDNFNLGQVPEPSSAALALLALPLAFVRRRSH